MAVSRQRWSISGWRMAHGRFNMIVCKINWVDQPPCCWPCKQDIAVRFKVIFLAACTSQFYIEENLQHHVILYYSHGAVTLFCSVCLVSPKCSVGA